MKEIPNIAGFPFHIKQTQPYFCIPASIEAVTKYFVPKSPVTQDYLWNAFVHACASQNLNPADISFRSIKELVIDRNPNYSWAESRYIDRREVHSFEELASLVKASVNNGLPHIISVPVQDLNTPGTLWHMLTAVGYDDLNLQVYDPDPSRQCPYELSLTRLHSDLQSLADAHVTDSFVLCPRRVT
jgi:hypothetical protein